MTDTIPETLAKGISYSQNQQDVLDLIMPFLPEEIRHLHCSPAEIGIALIGKIDLSGLRACILINGWNHYIFEDTHTQIIWIYVC